jgi:thiamine monophosphate synthase
MEDLLRDNIIKLKLENKNQAVYVANIDVENIDVLLDNIAKELYSGADIIIFDANLMSDDRMCIEVANKIKLLCGEFDASFFIKGRADIAYIVRSDGILLDNTDVYPEYAHEISGHNSILGFVGEPDVNNDLIDFIIDDKVLFCVKNKIKIPVKELK